MLDAHKEEQLDEGGNCAKHTINVTRSRHQEPYVVPRTVLCVRPMRSSLPSLCYYHLREAVKGQSLSYRG